MNVIRFSLCVIPTCACVHVRPVCQICIFMRYMIPVYYHIVGGKSCYQARNSMFPDLNRQGEAEIHDEGDDEETVCNMTSHGRHYNRV